MPLHTTYSDAVLQGVITGTTELALTASDLENRVTAIESSSARVYVDLFLCPSGTAYGADSSLDPSAVLGSQGNPFNSLGDAVRSIPDPIPDNASYTIWVSGSITGDSGSSPIIIGPRAQPRMYVDPRNSHREDVPLTIIGNIVRHPAIVQGNPDDPNSGCVALTSSDVVHMGYGPKILKMYFNVPGYDSGSHVPSGSLTGALIWNSLGDRGWVIANDTGSVTVMSRHGTFLSNQANVSIPADEIIFGSGTATTSVLQGEFNSRCDIVFKDISLTLDPGGASAGTDYLKFRTLDDESRMVFDTVKFSHRHGTYVPYMTFSSRGTISTAWFTGGLHVSTDGLGMDLVGGVQATSISWNSNPERANFSDVSGATFEADQEFAANFGYMNGEIQVDPYSNSSHFGAFDHPSVIVHQCDLSRLSLGGVDAVIQNTRISSSDNALTIHGLRCFVCVSTSSFLASGSQITGTIIIGKRTINGGLTELRTSGAFYDNDLITGSFNIVAVRDDYRTN